MAINKLLKAKLMACFEAMECLADDADEADGQTVGLVLIVVTPDRAGSFDAEMWTQVDKKALTTLFENFVLNHGIEVPEDSGNSR